MSHITEDPKEVLNPGEAWSRSSKEATKTQFSAPLFYYQRYPLHPWALQRGLAVSLGSALVIASFQSSKPCVLTLYQPWGERKHLCSRNISKHLLVSHELWLGCCQLQNWPEEWDLLIAFSHLGLKAIIWSGVNTSQTHDCYWDVFGIPNESWAFLIQKGDWILGNNSNNTPTIAAVHNGLEEGRQ